MTDVLDLTKVFARDSVKLPDGTSRELRNQQEFSILEWHKVVGLDKKARELQAAAAESEEAAQELSALQRDLAAMLIVDLGDAELPDWACAAILAFWTDRIQAAGEEGNPQRPRGRQTTASSSRGSKRSTAAPRKTGSTPRRGRSTST